MITKINKIPKREMTLGPKAAQLAWTSGHGSPGEVGVAQRCAVAQQRWQSSSAAQ